MNQTQAMNAATGSIGTRFPTTYANARMAVIPIATPAHSRKRPARRPARPLTRRAATTPAPNSRNGETTMPSMAHVVFMPSVVAQPSIATAPSAAGQAAAMTATAAMFRMSWPWRGCMGAPCADGAPSAPPWYVEVGARDGMEPSADPRCRQASRAWRGLGHAERPRRVGHPAVVGHDGLQVVAERGSGGKVDGIERAEGSRPDGASGGNNRKVKPDCRDPPEHILDPLGSHAGSACRRTPTLDEPDDA